MCLCVSSGPVLVVTSTLAVAISIKKLTQFIFYSIEESKHLV